MLRHLLLAALGAQLLLPLNIKAQDAGLSSSSLSTATDSEAPGSAAAQTTATPSTTPHGLRQADHLFGSVTFGYIYLDSQVGPGRPWNSQQQGFFAIPQVMLRPWLAAFADFTQSYTTSAGVKQNAQSRLGGLIVSYPSPHRITPLAFANGGVVRSSNAGTVTNSPAYAVGAGWTTRVHDRLSLLFVPAEYVRVYPPDGPRNNFTARIGLSIPLYRKPYKGEWSRPAPR